MKERKSKMVQQIKADSIIRETNPPQKMFVMKKKRLTRYTPAKCLLCGLGYDVLTYVHAGKHGYKSPDEMIKAGVIMPIGEVEELDEG